MKRQILFLSFIIISTASYAQIIKNGCYITNNGFICINNDTILICRDNYFNCYYGMFYKDGIHIHLGNNLLLGKTATIEVKTHNPDYVEIQLNSMYKNFVIGESIDNSVDTTIYMDTSPYYHIAINHECIYSDNTKTIRLEKGMFSSIFLSKGFLLHDDSRLSCFVDYYDIPLEFGRRYIFTQKYYPLRATIINMLYPQEFELLYYEQTERIVQKFNKNHIIEYQYKNSDYDSCFNEFKNRFPLLFE